jgi:hypothetical protein
LQVKLTWSKSVQVYPNLSKYVHKLLHTNQKSNTDHIQTSQKNYTVQKKTSQKTLQSKNKPLQHRLHTNHYIPKNKKHLKKKNQRLHSGLFFFCFDSIICNHFSMECTILFPLAAVEDVATTPLSATCGVLGVNPTTFPPVSPAAIDLAVRSIKTRGWGLIGTVRNMFLILLDSLLGGSGGGGLGATGGLFQLGNLSPTMSLSCHKFSPKKIDK